MSLDEIITMCPMVWQISALLATLIFLAIVLQMIVKKLREHNSGR